MKKKKIIILIFILCLALVGCEEKQEQIVTYEETPEVLDITSPSYKMDSILKDIKISLSKKNIDFIPLDSYLDSIINEAPADIVNKLIDMLYSFDYQIIEQSIEGERAVVKVTFASYDFVSTIKKTIVSITKDTVISSVINSNKSIEEVISDDVINNLNKLENTGRDRIITDEFVFLLEDNEWVFDNDSNLIKLLDAISGGLMSSLGEIEELIEKFY